MRIVILRLNRMKVILACYVSTVLLLRPGFSSSLHSSCLCTGIYHHALSIWNTLPSQSLSLTTLAASDSEEAPAHGEAANLSSSAPSQLEAAQ